MDWRSSAGAPLKYRSEAKASIWFFRSSAARWTTLPTTMVVREATVGPEFGTRPVSAIGKRMRAGASESASAAIWVKTVWTPWPISVEETRMLTPGLPSSSRASSMRPLALNLASPSPVNAAPWAKKASPTPWYFVLPLAEFAARGLLELLREIRAPERELETGGGPVFAVEHLAGGRGVARARVESAGGIRAAACRGAPAMASMCDSMPQMAWGAPKPRKAPHGKEFVRDDLAADDDVVAAVGHGAVQDAAEHHHVGNRQVGAAVEDEVAFDRGERAVLLDAGLVAHPHRMALGGVEDVLVALVDDLDRLAGLERRQRRVADQQGGILLLAAERAADGRLAHADFFGRELERIVQLMHGEIGALDGAFGQDRAILLREHDEALVLEIELFLVAGPVFRLDDFVRFGEALGEVALDDGLVLHRSSFSGVALKIAMASSRSAGAGSSSTSTRMRWAAAAASS